MIHVKTSDKAVKTLFGELARLLVEGGAVISSDLKVEIKGSEINYGLKRLPQAEQPLISLPPRCMPRLQDYHWSLSASKRLQWQAIESGEAQGVSENDRALQHGIVDLLTQLYNRFDKVAAFARYAPAVQFFGHQQLFVDLMDAAQEQAFLTQRDQGLDAMMIEAFWQGRIFTSINTGELHLIPMMEFFNHHIFAKGFGWGPLVDGQRTLSLDYRPVEGTSGKKDKQVYACYEIMDNLHAFAKYGFIDPAAFFVQSQPFSIEVGQGLTFEVGYQSVTANQCYVHEWQVEPLYQNSLMYRSRLKPLDGRYFSSYMLVPPARQLPAFEDALLAQLREIEAEEAVENGAIANTETVGRIKEKLLAVNVACYRKIKHSAEDAALTSTNPTARMLTAMLKHQFAILREFKANIS